MNAIESKEPETFPFQAGPGLRGRVPVVVAMAAYEVYGNYIDESL
jgi:hypothetical protein